MTHGEVQFGSRLIGGARKGDVQIHINKRDVPAINAFGAWMNGSSDISRLHELSDDFAQIVGVPVRDAVKRTLRPEHRSKVPFRRIVLEGEMKDVFGGEICLPPDPAFLVKLVLSTMTERDRVRTIRDIVKSCNNTTPNSNLAHILTKIAFGEIQLYGRDATWPGHPEYRMNIESELRLLFEGVEHIAIHFSTGDKVLARRINGKPEYISYHEVFGEIAYANAKTYVESILVGRQIPKFVEAREHCVFTSDEELDPNQRLLIPLSTSPELTHGRIEEAKPSS